MFEKPGNLIKDVLDLTKTKGCFPPLIIIPPIIENKSH